MYYYVLLFIYNILFIRLILTSEISWAWYADHKCDVVVLVLYPSTSLVLHERFVPDVELWISHLSRRPSPDDVYYYHVQWTACPATHKHTIQLQFTRQSHPVTISLIIHNVYSTCSSPDSHIRDNLAHHTQSSPCKFIKCHPKDASIKSRVRIWLGRGGERYGPLELICC